MKPTPDWVPFAILFAAGSALVAVSTNSLMMGLVAVALFLLFCRRVVLNKP